MPAENQTNALAKQFGAKLNALVKKGADTPVDYGRQGLPGGIRNAIAKFEGIKLGTVAAGKKNAGAEFFTFSGVVMEPKEVTIEGQTENIEGGQTFITVFITDRPAKGDDPGTTKQLQMNKVINEINKLGGEGYTSEAKTVEELVKMAQQLADGNTYFKFSTVKRPEKVFETGPKKGQVQFSASVNHYWNGGRGLEDYIPPDGSEGDDDATGDAADAEASEDVTEEAAAPPRKAPPPKGRGKPAPAPEPEDELTTMAAATADDPDGAALDAFKEKVREDHGWTDEQLDAFQGSWEELAAHVLAGGEAPEVENDAQDTEEEEAAEADDDANWVPDLGDIYSYQPVDPKTKKGKVDAKKKPVLVEVKIKAVYAKNRTVDLINMEDKKTVYKGVPVDDLQSA